MTITGSIRIALVAGLACLGGCISTSLDGRTGVPDPHRPVPLTFEYQRTEIPFTNHNLSELDERDYAVKQITFSSAGENGQPDNQVSARYYQSKSPGKKRLLIVLPIWGSYTYPSDEIAQGIRSRNPVDTNVLMILGENFLVNWYDIAAAQDEEQFYESITRMGSRLQTAVIDSRRIIDWAQSRDEIDPDRIGLIGFSLGALVGGLVIASDERLSASVLVMGASDFPQVMAYCEGRPGMAREALMERFGWTAKEYQEHIAGLIGHLDPAPFSHRIDPSRVLMVDAYYDTCMPRAARDALWYAMGQPQRISFLAGHKTSFLFMTPLAGNYMRGRIYGFLEQKL